MKVFVGQKFNMLRKVMEQALNDLDGLGLFAFGLGTNIYMFKQKVPQQIRRFFHLRTHSDFPRIDPVGLDQIENHRIDSVPVLPSQDIQALCGNLTEAQHAAPDRIIKIMVDVGYPVGNFDDLPFQCCRFVRTCVIQDAVPDLPGQIKPPASFQYVYNPETLLVVLETRSKNSV